MQGQDRAMPSGAQPDNYREPGQAFELGLSIRDFVARKAMQAIISHPGMEPDDSSREGVAQLAYEFADALINQSTK